MSSVDARMTCMPVLTLLAIRMLRFWHIPEYNHNYYIPLGNISVYMKKKNLSIWASQEIYAILVFDAL